VKSKGFQIEQKGKGSPNFGFKMARFKITPPKSTVV